jgi:mycoredoxin
VLTTRNTAPAGSVETHVTAVMTDVKMYTTSWCGYCVRLKSQLRRAGISFSEVNIETEPDAADLVERVNKGNQTVPTLVFADGSALTNPSVAQVAHRLAAVARR